MYSLAQLTFFLRSVTVGCSQSNHAPNLGPLIIAVNETVIKAYNCKICASRMKNMLSRKSGKLQQFSVATTNRALTEGEKVSTAEISQSKNELICRDIVSSQMASLESLKSGLLTPCVVTNFIAGPCTFSGRSTSLSRKMIFSVS